MSVLPYYAGWRRYNELLTDAIGAMSDAELALRPVAGDHWPIWAIAAHMHGRPQLDLWPPGGHTVERAG